MNDLDDVPTWSDVERDLRRREGRSVAANVALSLLAFAVLASVTWYGIGQAVAWNERSWVAYQDRVEAAEDDLNDLYAEQIDLKAKKISAGRGTAWVEDVYIDGTLRECLVIRVNEQGYMVLTSDRMDYPLALRCSGITPTEEAP